MMVEGEVRTTDSSGNPRLWGRGRESVGVHETVAGFPCVNGDLRFGLSTVDVSWGSAAHACPAGSWVCKINDLLACNTTRPDDSNDGLNCLGSHLDFPETGHWGWVQNANFNQGRAFSEDAINGGRDSCHVLPVWCCWEAESTE